MSNPIWLYVLIGLAAGLLSGLFGIGGGIIIVPALIFLAGFTQLQANGTSLAALLAPVGILAVMTYYRNGNVDVKAAVFIAIALLVAAAFSAYFAQKLNPGYLRIAFGMFIIIMGCYTVYTGVSKL
ncbi:MAG: TSUP family transporter [Dehalococcoidia bacterium]|nr:TSUP family transporter [Dehalococcoidia bacterium]